MAAEDTKSARETMEKSRLDVIECEEEIKSIKDALKSLAMGAAGGGPDDKSSLNQLEVSVHKVKKAGAAADDNDADDKTDDNTPTTFKIHLSSPIEENTITQLYDPLNPTAPGSIAKFESIETSNALLTVEVYTKDELMKLGVSAPHDLLPLCEDMGKGGGVEKKSSMLEIAIVAEGGMDDVVVEEEEVSEANEEAAVTTAEGGGAAETTTEDVESEPSWEDAVAEEEKEGGETKDEESPKEEEEGTPPQSDEKEDDETKDTPAKDDAESEESTKPQEEETKTTPTLQLPIYTLTVQLEYTPSPNDRRDALYVQLNEVSKRKVAAIESLRKQAGIISRVKAATSGGPPSSPTKDKGGRAVKAGFLNKSKAAEEKQPPFWKRWYEKTIGPKSMLWVVGPIAKNYVIFVGASLFIHFKGDLLALPPPV
ncbi:hypothetical protein ACHAXR_008247 [Thalassiosira sp. AJA248-18]